MTGAAALAALRNGAAWARQDRDIVVVSGPDAVAYLQGQLSQDVDVPPGTVGRWSFLLEPQGKVDAWLRVHRRQSDQYLLDVEPGSAEVVVARLRRFLLRTRIDIDVERGWCLCALRGVAPPDRAPHEALVGDAPWPGAEGYDLIAPDGPPASLVDELPEVGPDVLEWLRIASGVPRFGAELRTGVIPAEAGQWVVDSSVSFTKGCYTGQELVARIDSRGGNVPRRLRGLIVEGDGTPPIGAAVVVSGEAVGEVTSAAATPFGTLALAYVRRAVDPGIGAVYGSVMIGEEPRNAQIRALPLLPLLVD
ncbi:MAG: hypothetical protein N2037_14210 [Acidimicrobiales bacterium]|nr:hypothetical protein [Acidimicrobiales bacterium]